MMFNCIILYRTADDKTLRFVHDGAGVMRVFADYDAAELYVRRDHSFRYADFQIVELDEV